MPTIRIISPTADLLEIPKIVAQEYNQARKKPDAILVRNDNFGMLVLYSTYKFVDEVNEGLEGVTIGAVGEGTYDTLITTTRIFGDIKFRPRCFHARFELERSPEICIIYHFETVK